VNDVSDAAVSLAAKMVGSAPVVAFEPDADSPKPVTADAAIARLKQNQPRRLATMVAKTNAAEWESAIESPLEKPNQPVAVVTNAKTVPAVELLESECVTESRSDEAKMLVAVATVAKTEQDVELARPVFSVAVASGDVPETLAAAATDVPTEQDASPEDSTTVSKVAADSSEIVPEMPVAVVMDVPPEQVASPEMETATEMETASVADTDSVAASDTTSVTVTAVADAEKVVDWAKDAVSATVADDTPTAVKSLTPTKLLTPADWLHNSPIPTTRFEALVISSTHDQRQSVDKPPAFDD